MFIFESILTTFKSSIVFRSSWGSSENFSSFKIEPSHHKQIQLVQIPETLSMILEEMFQKERNLVNCSARRCTLIYGRILVSCRRPFAINTFLILWRKNMQFYFRQFLFCMPAAIPLLNHFLFNNRKPLFSRCPKIFLSCLL